MLASIGSAACGSRPEPVEVVSRYVESWSADREALAATVVGPDADALLERIAVLRPHLRASPRLEVPRVHRDRVEGDAVLPLKPDAEMRLPITAVVREGRVLATPSAIARDLRSWPDLGMDRRHVRRGRLLDRDGAALDPDRDAALLATLRPIFADRLGGGWSYRISDGDTVLAALEVPEASDVRLSLDPAVQEAAVSATGSDDRRGLVAIDASTGAIVAFAGGITDGRAVGATVVPVGSVFKIATITAALLEGWSPEDAVRCPAAVVVEGRAVQNAGRLEAGEVSLRRAFALSCNTTFARLGAELGGERLREAALTIGFTSRVAGIAAGRVDTGRSGERAAELGFGAEGAEASAVGLASVAATLGAGGIQRTPSWETTDPTGRRTVPANVAEAVLEIMRDAVEHGTATRAAVAGVDVAAKTGTPRRSVDEGVVDDGLTVAVLAVGDRIFGAAAVVLEGRSGSRTAAPMVAAFAQRLLAR